MDALTPTEIFALRRTEQLVALDDLRVAQLQRIAPAAPREEDPAAHLTRTKRTAVLRRFPADAVGAVIDIAR